MPDHLPPIGIAHAGNNRPRLRLALDAGVDMIEADLWRRGAGFALHHERRLPLLPLLYERWHLRVARGLLSLDTLLETVDGRAGLLLDLKSGGRHVAGALVGALDRHPELRHAEVSSHHWSLLRRLRRLRPDLPVYFSIGRERMLAAFERLLPALERPAGVSIHHRLLDARTVERLKLRELRVYAWTVPDRERAQVLADWGVDGVTCDDLSILASLRLSRRVA